MEQQTPLFLMRARDLAIFIFIIVGLGLLFVYGSRAIATADDKRYIEGWNNRPFLTTPVVSEKPTRLETDTTIKMAEQAPRPAKTQTQASVTATTLPSEQTQSKRASANAKAKTKHTAASPDLRQRSSTKSRTWYMDQQARQKKRRQSLNLRLDLSVEHILRDLGL